jgi:type II secretion system protein N
VDLRVPDGHTEQAAGNVTFNIDDLRVGDGHAQYQIPHFGGITVEQIRAGRLEGAIAIRDGVATIERLASRSNEFQLAGDGRVELRPELNDSVVNLGLRFQLTDAYRHKSEQAGRIMLVMDTVPDLRQARRPDGMLAFRCRGTFSRGLQCPPDTRGGGGGAGGGAGGIGPGAGVRSGGNPFGARRGFEP